MREAALPLLAASLTRDPAKVAAVAFAGRLPWLLFSLLSGALVDRTDRRRVMWQVDLLRALVVTALAAAVLLESTSIALLVVIAFVLGTGETLFDNAAQALMPAVVGREHLEAANTRLYAAQISSQEFVGPPVGSLLFAVAMAVPFFLDAGSFALAAGLVLAMRGTYRAPHRPSEGRPRLRSEIAEGLRWLWRHRLLRTLAVMLGVWNLLTTASAAIFVLFATQDLHVSKAGYGLLFSAGAVGSLLGTALATRVTRTIGPGRALLLAVAISSAADFAVAGTSSAYLVGAMGALGSMVGIIWNVVTVSLRQAIIPDELLGRVNSVYRFLGWGMMPIGAAVGGVLATAFGLRSTFWVAGAVLAAMALLTFRTVNNKAIAEARAAGSLR
ncbi:MAG: Na+/melibiose symporter-like transporter [Acidimicrobiales bacterium]|nr:Na+/melibiose symporter-like transporter [Acidimicrobiales bacterium]